LQPWPVPDTSQTNNSPTTALHPVAYYSKKLNDLQLSKYAIPPQRIYNMDEAGFQEGEDLIKRVFDRRGSEVVNLR